jgi:pimeloyl-ACP methyl ester carboxylesterase
VQREIEDIDAVISAAGGTAFLYGSSSGAALALEAAASGLSIAKLALWEPPYSADENAPRPPANTAAVYTQFVSEGRRGDAVEYFMSKVVGLPDEFVAQARSAPWWSAQEALAHTLAYDATVMGDYLLPVDRAASVTVPTLVLAGGASWDWMRNTAKKLAEVLPKGQYQELEGQTHDVSADVLAPALAQFFGR